VRTQDVDAALDREQEGPTDSAALAGATMAAVLTVVIPKGPFDSFSIPIGVSLAVLVCAFELHRRRTAAKSLAFATALSFPLLLIVGPFVEAARQGWTLSFFFHGGNEADGRVEPWLLTLVWVVLAVLVYAVDRKGQRRRAPLQLGVAA
jgi:formate hydrogenlyase subunit 3/multisubunit Na+/H+ antiporter MnhD subunit